MTPDDALSTLRGHQEEITALLRQADEVLTGPTRDVTERVAHLRWQLFRVLRAYQLFKHTEVFDPLMRGSDTGRSALAGDMKARCTAIGEDYTRHTAEWTLSRSGDDWTLYRDRSRAMLARIRRHLSREAREAAVLLDGIDRTRRP